MKHVWLTNVLDPNNAALRTADHSHDASAEAEIGLLRDWLSQIAVGEPKAVEGTTAEQLKAEGYIGVYKLIY